MLPRERKTARLNKKGSMHFVRVRPIKHHFGITIIVLRKSIRIAVTIHLSCHYHGVRTNRRPALAAIIAPDVTFTWIIGRLSVQ